ncbi:MAG: SDR family oxidoreductase [Alphaproteobacteria bacterium]|nr:SDR family oxidoreductase [Alphaproteobacteria bacterium]
MKLVVFGGTGPTGKRVVEKALAEGMQVRVLARSPEKVTHRPSGLEVMAGDALQPEDVAQAILGQDAVVTTLGVPYTFKPVTVYSVGIRNILDGMQQAGVRRLVAVTSGGTHPGRDPNNPFFFEFILKPIVGRTLYADMRRMEALLFASEVDWTLLRPPRLLDKPATGRVRVAPDVYTLPDGGTVSRADLADVIVQQLQSTELIRKAAVVAD